MGMCTGDSGNSLAISRSSSPSFQLHKGGDRVWRTAHCLCWWGCKGTRASTSSHLLLCWYHLGKGQCCSRLKLLLLLCCLGGLGLGQRSFLWGKSLCRCCSQVPLGCSVWAGHDNWAILAPGSCVKCSVNDLMEVSQLCPDLQNIIVISISVPWVSGQAETHHVYALEILPAKIKPRAAEEIEGQVQSGMTERKEACSIKAPEILLCLALPLSAALCRLIVVQVRACCKVPYFSDPAPY